METYRSKLGHLDTCMLVAKTVAASRSKDPNTQVGAVVFHPKSGGMFPGYNGFPPGFPDLKEIWDNRDPKSPDCKYNFVVHAEVNAVRKAMMAIGDLSDCIMVVTHFPCHNCMKDAIAMSGIKTVVYESDYPANEISLKIAAALKINLVKS